MNAGIQMLYSFGRHGDISADRKHLCTREDVEGKS